MREVIFLRFFFSRVLGFDGWMMSTNRTTQNDISERYCTMEFDGGRGRDSAGGNERIQVRSRRTADEVEPSLCFTQYPPLHLLQILWCWALHSSHCIPHS